MVELAGRHRPDTNITIFRCDVAARFTVAAQKYGGDSTHPIWRDIGTTSRVGSDGSWGITCAKFHFHSSPSSLSILQNPSLTSHFAINIFSSSLDSPNTWMIRESNCLSWLMAPRGAVFFFFVVSFTDGNCEPSCSRRLNIDLLAKFLIVVEDCPWYCPTTQFWPVLMSHFLCILVRNVLTPLEIVLTCVALLQLPPIFFVFDQLRPVHAGHPNDAYSGRSSAAGCSIVHCSTSRFCSLLVLLFAQHCSHLCALSTMIHPAVAWLGVPVASFCSLANALLNRYLSLDCMLCSWGAGAACCKSHLLVRYPARSSFGVLNACGVTSSLSFILLITWFS